MMNKYDEILQIFASQKEEISVMSNKINELERTNMFLMQFIEKKNHLPAVCDVGDIHRYKELAVDKELTLNIARDKAHKDATVCETSLNASFNSQDVTECQNSLRFSNIDTDDESCVIIPSAPRFMSISRSDDVTIEPAIRILLAPVSSSTNLQLQISHLSPTRRQINVSRNVLNSVEINDNAQSHEQSQSSNEKKDTVIVRSVPDIVKTSHDLSSTNKSERFHVFPKTLPSDPNCNTSDSLVNCQSPDDMKLKHAIDYLITTLEERKSRLKESCELSVKEQCNIFTKNDTIDELLTNKDQILHDFDDKHTQMKLLLTSQQLRADMYHNVLQLNNRKIIDAGSQLLQQNSSNRTPMNETCVKEAEVSEINTKMIPQLLEVRLRRQHELNRLNNNIRDQALLDPKVKRGFAKFSALIKGYLVRTLLETDKVRGVIMTIKDTAQMALAIRQERLAGDCAPPGECTSYSILNRRNHQETISFQHRLVSQLRHGLNELHAIFFTWSSYSQMTLVRNHINQLISAATNCQLIDKTDGPGPSTVSVNKIKKAAPLSSATVKRRQKLALRSAVASTNDNGNKNSSSWTGQRKPIYTSPYGCRGYAVGSHSRTGTGQSKNGVDRKSRTGSLSHRRGTLRKITELSVNPTSSHPKPTVSSTAINNTEPFECPINEKISNGITKTTANKIKQQQQWIQPKTVTTNICSPASGDTNLCQAGFVASTFDTDSYTLDTNGIGENSSDREMVSTSPRKSNFLPNNFAEIQANTNNADWRSKTYNFTNARNPKPNGNGFINGDHNSNKIKDKLSKVEVCIDDFDYSTVNEPHINAPLVEKYNRRIDYAEDPIDHNNIVLVDISQPSTESDSTTNELKSTFNSNTNHCLNKPVVTDHNTKYIKTKTKSKNVPLPIPIVNDFDLSPVCNIVSGRTFRIRKRIVACNSIYSSSATSHS